VDLRDAHGIMSAVLFIVVIIVGAWLFYHKRAPSPERVKLPYLKFETDNSAARYRSESETL